MTEHTKDKLSTLAIFCFILLLNIYFDLRDGILRIE